MKKLFIEALAFIITERCNLNCSHCLRGQKQNSDISLDVINKTLDQIGCIGILNVCGGEPTLAVDKIGYLFRGIIDRHIYVSDVAITINGTIYDSKFIDLCSLMDQYIKGYCDIAGGVSLYVSDDIYHKEEMEQKNIWYAKEYLTCEFIKGARTIDPNYKLLNVGNAEMLDESLKVPFRPMRPIIAAYQNKNYSISHRIGPLVTINIDGIITEDNVPYDKQQMLYNYGNVFDDNIVDALIRNGAKVVKSDLTYRILESKEQHKFLTYKK